MCRLIGPLAGVMLAATLCLALHPGAAVAASKGKVQAFNPQPDPPGKRAKHILGPNTKGSWKSYHDVEKFKSKGGSKSLTASPKTKKAK